MARKKKHVHGDGSVHPHKTRGGFQGQWTHEESKKRYTVYGKTEEECWRKLDEKKEEVKRQLSPVSSWTFERYVNWWLEAKEHKYRANTLYRIRHFFDVYGFPTWGKIKLSKLTPAHFQNWVNARAKEGLLKPSSIRQYLSYAHTALEYAVRTRILAFNPCQYMDFPVDDEEEEEPAIFTPAQAVQLVELAEEPWKSLFLFFIGTGVRRNEALACRWGDIDMEAGTWKVVHNFAVLPGGIVEGKPKTKSSIRTIVLPEFVRSLLVKLQHEQKKMKLMAGADWENKDLVFCTEAGGILPDYRLYWAFGKTLRQMGLSKEEIKKLHPHSLRHSVGTWLSDDLKEVQALLGHSTLSMTMDVYSHRMPGRAEQTMSRLNDMVVEQMKDQKEDKLG